MFINIYHYIDLEIGNVDYVFIFIDMDMVILEINSESMFISIIFKKTQKNTNHCVSTDINVFDCAIIVRFLSYLATANSIRSQQAWFNIALHCLADRMKSSCHAKMAAAIDKESHHH